MKQEAFKSDFETFCNEIAQKHQIPGLSIGLAKDGELIYEKGFGYRDTEKGLPLTTDTVFGIGSVTKSFTAVAILQLQEAGKLSVNDPILKYIPELKTPKIHEKDDTSPLFDSFIGFSVFTPSLWCTQKEY